MLGKIVAVLSFVSMVSAQIECYDYTLIGGYNLGSEKIVCKEGQSCYNMMAMHENTSIIRSGGCVHNTLCSITFSEGSCQEANIGGLKVHFCCCEDAEKCKWDSKMKGFLHRSLDWVKTKLGLHSHENEQEMETESPRAESQTRDERLVKALPSDATEIDVDLVPTRAV
ncbi:unnamed protein product, partial [Mesorhabditis belari]